MPRPKGLDELTKYINAEISTEKTPYGKDNIKVEFSKEKINGMRIKVPYVTANNRDLMYVELDTPDGNVVFREVYQDNRVDVVVFLNDNEIGRVTKGIIQGVDGSGGKLAVIINPERDRKRRAAT